MATKAEILDALRENDVFGVSRLYSGHAYVEGPPTVPLSFGQKASVDNTITAGAAGSREAAIALVESCAVAAQSSLLQVWRHVNS